jgi:hypothetical protein
MQNLSTIYTHLAQGELPQTDGGWIKAEQLAQRSAPDTLSDTIQSLSQLVLAAVSSADTHLNAADCLQLIGKIESQAAKLTSRTVSFTPSKNKLIDLIADQALLHLDAEFATTPAKMERILKDWNQILQQQRQTQQPKSEKVNRLEKQLSVFLKQSTTREKLQQIAQASLLTQVNSYLKGYAKAVEAVRVRDTAALKALITFPEFSLTAPLDREGNTLLHKLAKEGLFESAELLVQNFPRAVDVPNNAFKLPFSDSGYHLHAKPDEKHPALEKVFEEKAQGLEWCRTHPEWVSEYPNQTMLWLQHSLEKGLMNDAALCQFLRDFPLTMQGQRGRNLLYTAVEGGHLLIAKQLLDLGVSPQGIYDEPFSIRRTAHIDTPLTTPLHQAVAAGYADLTALLLERGADIYAPNGKGFAVIELLTKPEFFSERPYLGYQFPAIDVYRILETKIAPKDQKLFRQALFKHAVDTHNWPEAARLLKAGAVPPNKEVQSWALQAVAQGQFTLVQLLIEQGHIKKITAELATKVIDQAPLAWSYWFLEQMAKPGLNFSTSIKSTLLNRAIEKRDFPLAAFLISRGARSTEAHKGLLHYASQLTQGTSVERQLKNLINAKNIAHLVGDPHIGEMHGDDGKRLEGSLSSESIAFFGACLDYVQEAHPELVSPQLVHVCQQLQKAWTLALRIESLETLEDDEVLSTGIKHLEADLLGEIEQLEAGQAVAFPAGWLSGDVGHAILVECKLRADQQLEINVINTGAGVEFHGAAHDQARVHVNTVRQHVLSLEQLKARQILRKLIEPKAVTSNKRRYFAEDFYGALAPFRMVETALPASSDLQTKSKKAQLTGTCALRCLLAYAKLSLGTSEYKLLKDILTSKVLQLSLEQNRQLLDQQPALAKLLSLAAPHLFHNLIKRLSAEISPERQLEQLTAFKSELQQALPKPESQNKHIPLDESFPIHAPSWISQAMNALLDFVQKLSTFTYPASTEPALKPLPAADLTQLSSVAALENHLQAITEGTKTHPDPDFAGHYLTSALLTLGRSFLAPASSSPLAQVWRALKQDAEACARVVAQLELLAAQLVDARYKAEHSSRLTYKSNLGGFAALQYALVIGRELCLQIEEQRHYPEGGRIRDYSFALLPKSLDLDTLSARLALHAEIELDFRQLIQYDAQHQKQSGNLFSFLQDLIPHVGISLKNQTTPEYKYALEHAKTHTDWQAADERYREVTDDLRLEKLLPDVDKETWRIHWFYVHGLPQHFQQLRRLAFLSWISPPDMAPVQSLSDQAPDIFLYKEMRRRTADNKVVTTPSMLYHNSYGAPINTQAVGLDEGLPKDSGGLVRLFAQGERPLELQPYGGQNRSILAAPNLINRELMSIRSSVTTCEQAFYSPITVPLLLDFFAPQHLHELGHLERRLFFEATLFAALRLPLAIQELPTCAKELKTFFHSALNHFEDKLATSIEVSRSLAASAFLLTQWQRALVYLEKGGVSQIEGQPVAELLEQVRAKIQQQLQDPKTQDEELRQQLHLALVDSYHGSSLPDSLSHNVVVNMAAYWKSVHSHQASQKLFPAFVESATLLPVEKQALIQNSLKIPDTARKILGAAAELYNLSLPESALWKEAQFPIYSCLSSRGLVELNVLTGRFLIAKQTPMALPKQMRSTSPSYQELFGEAKLNVIDCNTYLQAQDAFGSIQILVSAQQPRKIEKICRMFDNQWYFHIPSKEKESHPLMPQFPNLNRLTLWSSSQQPLHYLYVDPHTLQPVVCLDADGHLTLIAEQPAQRWEWVQMHTLDIFSDLQALDKDAFILQAATTQTPRPMLMYFPHLKDENGNGLEFERRWLPDKKEVRWVMRNRPHLFLATEQRLPGVRGCNNFLILENANGARSALIPIKTRDELAQNISVDVGCMHVHLKEDTLTSPEPQANAYLAYLALTHALTPEDYQLALAFLKKARKFERYTTEELRLLGLLYTSHKTTHDNSGPADALRLFAHWLVDENFRRNPAPKGSDLNIPKDAVHIKLRADSPAAHWQLFWEGKLPQEPPAITKEQSTHYFERQVHLPYGMRLQDNLSPQELQDWPMPRLSLSSDISVPALPIAVELEEVVLLSNLLETERRPALPIPSRPSREILGKQFRGLLEAAASQEPERRRIAEEQWQAMRFDPDTQTFSQILAAALASQKNLKAQAVMQCVRKIMYPRAAFGEDNSQWALTQKLQAALKAFAPSVSPLYRQPSPPPQVTPVEVLPPPQPILLPKKPPQPEPLAYITSHKTMDIPRFTRLFKHAFTPSVGAQAEKAEPFAFETDDPWLKQSLQELNEDYLAGADKNQLIPQYLLKQGITVQRLLSVHKRAIKAQAEHYAHKVLHTQEKALITLANRPPPDKREALKHAAEIASGRKKALDIRDCVGLFLQSDPEAYRRATHLKSDKEIADFHNQIGDYILYHNKVTQYREVLKAFEQLEKLHQAAHTPEQLQYALQRLAEALHSGTDYASRLAQLQSPEMELEEIAPVEAGDIKRKKPALHLNPAVPLVFEYALNLTLKDQQLEGLHDMMQAADTAKTRYRSALLQRIQGAGKSLVFGHIMALLKADGYHLSVHVPATPQYKTALYDMRERSEQIFRQREHTLVFDDEPAKFTPEYLTWMKQMLAECIVRRDYVTLTNETLRAMRCKYIKTRFEIKKAAPEADISKLEQSNQLLKEILHLLRTRGIFTFDEMHKTFDPLKELNMPYGQPQNPDQAESQLIAEILRHACLAIDPNGAPLLDLEHSANQTSAQAAAMKSWIVEQLCQKPGWGSPEIKAYLEGKAPDIPADLERPEHKYFMRLVVLARQMLAGNWLQERLSLNVNEHHGVPPKNVEGMPRVSIPFIANMKPAYGSEFSDRYVMTSNTLIAYLASGLNAQQTHALIEDCRQLADLEKIELKETHPSCSIRETAICRRFSKAAGIDLYSIDLEKPEQVRQVQQALLKRNAEAMQLLCDFVISQEISPVELFENQVCSNGQNEASMCQSFAAYSASMENPNMAPVGSVKKPEKGTNGQTSDRLIQQKTEVHLVDDQISSLFAMMKSSANSQKIHALIDVGAYFRGKDNASAARMICDHLREIKSPIQGVLFFDDATDDLCFMQRDPPHAIKILSGTTPEVIEAETGFSKDQLFTYYDQDHMTGVDIAQDDQAVAVMTMSRHTKIHELLQGARRMRQLDLQQRIMVALPKNALPRISAELNTSFKEGEVPSIKQLLLFAHLNEARGQKGENLLYALQKVENLIQQLILDRLYTLDVAQERALFDKTSDLFEKSVAIDLYLEYAHKRGTAKIQDYMNSVKKTLLAPLEPLLPPAELQALSQSIDQEILTQQTYAGMPSQVEVPASFSPDQKQHPLPVQNRETSRIQAKQQERISAKLESKKQENIEETQQEYLKQVESRRIGKKESLEERNFPRELFFSKTFGEPEKHLDINAQNPACWTLNAALAAQKTQKTAFDPHILTTSNAARVREEMIDLLGPLRKKPWPVLVLCDALPDGTKEWKVLLCSVADGINFQKLLTLKDSFKDAKGVEGRQIWLVRANGKELACPSELNIDSDPELARLMTQTLFFTGDFEALSYSPWRARLESWFSSLQEQERQEWIRFFENEILMGDPPGFKSSPLYRYFKRQ